MTLTHPPCASAGRGPARGTWAVAVHQDDRRQGPAGACGLRGRSRLRLLRQLGGRPAAVVPGRACGPSTVSGPAGSEGPVAQLLLPVAQTVAPAAPGP